MLFGFHLGFRSWGKDRAFGGQVREPSSAGSGLQDCRDTDSQENVVSEHEDQTDCVGHFDCLDPHNSSLGWHSNASRLDCSSIKYLYGTRDRDNPDLRPRVWGGVTEMTSEPIVINLRNDRALGIINATIIIRRTPIEFMVFAAEEADDFETQHDEALLAAEDDPVDDPMEDLEEDTEDPDEDPEEDPTTVFDFPTSPIPSIDGYSTDDDDSTEGDQILPDVVTTDDDETSEDSASREGIRMYPLPIMRVLTPHAPIEPVTIRR
ncbi:hypothetical protein POM88_013269 [Heracleum sosnowskyi]|uniref:Uncharacterized protein n=1 Tax=Heracleum sosnowskyi TaxID=360622 RepID=A0AAD8J088_9APIA|nr:hypothetical protein POM88_013269 [Heracleum sosnowskyi]